MVVGMRQALGQTVLTHLVRVRNTVPMARRRRNSHLRLHGNRHLNFHFLLYGVLFDNLVIHFNRHVDGEVLLNDDGDFTLNHHLDGGGDIDDSLGHLFDGPFFKSVDVGDGGHIIRFANSDDEGFFIGDCLDQFLGLLDSHVDESKHGHFTGDSLDVVLRNLAFFGSDDDLDLSG